MLRLALERTGFSAGEAVMVGDRLYTDIASPYQVGHTQSRLAAIYSTPRFSRMQASSSF